MTIHELDQSIIEKIAAGEVVERPANIVKELLENAIDAGATSIIVEVKNGGKTQILVRDNGCGISKEELPLAIKRHATSKVQTLDDLESIQTLGFRGEALASISAVSKVLIQSRYKSSSNGFEIQVEGGRVISESECAHDIGTTVCMTDLFYNVPARLKFLRTSQTEFSHIAQIISQYSILNQHVSFILKHNDSIALKSPAVPKLVDKLSQIYGLTVAKGAIEFDYTDEQSQIQVTGVLSNPSQTRKDKEGITFFVNNRYVKNIELVQSVVLGYQTLLMIGRFPYAVIHIHVKSDIVDVNVHPRKDFVKFSDEELIKRVIQDAVYQTLKDKEFIATPKPTTEWYEENLAPHQEVREELVTDSTKSQLVIEKSKPNQNHLKEQTVVEPQTVLEQTSQKIQTNMDSFSELIYIGILLKTYICCQSNKDVILIDFHAAHERYLYEQFKTQYESKEIQTQELVEPIICDASQKLINIVEIHNDFLQSIGIDVSIFGEQKIIIRTVPIIAHKQLSTQTVLDIMFELPLEPVTHSPILHTLTERIFSTMGCRAAYKAGDDITSELAKKIVKWLLTSKQRFACPHGRPIFVQLSSYELEKMFKRKV